MRRRLVPISASEPAGDRRSVRLVDAARELLAERDYEAFSVAELAKRAGCSVGAFYGRYADKENFLAGVVWRTFHDAKKRTTDDFESRGAGIRSIAELARQVAQIVSDEIGEGRTAGVTRAAVKLAATRPGAADPLLDYRALVTDRAAEALAKVRPGRGARDRAREGVQIAFAVMIDSVLMQSGPLKPGSRKMVDALEAILARHFAAK